MKYRDEFKDEHDLQRYVVTGLRERGLAVRVTSKNTRGKKQDASLADLLVRDKSWQKGRWLAIEIKYPPGHWKFSSVAQQVAYVEREIWVCTSWEDVCNALGIDSGIN